MVLFQVEPFAGIVDSCRIYIPRLLFNREAVGPFKSKPRMNDVTVKGSYYTNKELIDFHLTCTIRYRNNKKGLSVKGQLPLPNVNEV